MNEAWAHRNSHDRALGELWEDRFSWMAWLLGMECRKPKTRWADRVVVRAAFQEWHELKHKAATRNDEYGLEAYRFGELLSLQESTGDPVLYTIHDWRRAGSSQADAELPCRIVDWFTADVLALASHVRRESDDSTYFGGRAAKARVLYWSAALWEPLGRRWGVS